MDELTFLDLAILKKIDAESSVEKFGSLINTSFFETANLLGTMKIKGYINIESSVGGISRVSLTDAGASILQVAEQKSKEPLEPLDNAILHALASGAKDLESIQKALNVRNADLAYHINKLVSQGFMDYEVRSAKVYFVLTESGFNLTGGIRISNHAPGKPAVTLADFVEPESSEPAIHASKSVSPAKPPEEAKSPPWVKDSFLGKEEKKEDVEHILKEEHPKKAETKHGQKKHHKEISPEEAKKIEKWKRRISKLEYYVREYSPYLILFLVVLAVFLGVIYISISKMAG
ncbi:MAG: hypothetical protein QW275_01600 [Candidatus Anstonellaceae archaeon]